MKKQYVIPQIELTRYKAIESIAKDNFFSDPWGFDEDLTELDDSDEE